MTLGTNGMSVEKELSDDEIKQLFDSSPELLKRTTDRTRHGCWCCGYRWLTIGLMALGMVAIHAQRINISVALLSVYDSLEDKVGHRGTKGTLPTQTSWSALQISLIHSSFYIGYIVTQVPAGIISYRLPAHRLFGGAIFVSCALNTLLPVIISNDVYWGTLLLRFFQGLAEGFIWPCSFVMINYWTTKEEMNKLAGFVASGSYAGAILGFPICGLVTHFLGWQYMFYMSGGAGVLWCLVWTFVVYEKPDHHPRISEEELLRLTQHKAPHFKLSIRQLPWRELFSSAPFLAICACAFAKGWVFNLLLTQEPTYMHVFGFNMAENGALSALPFILKLIVCYISGVMADLLVNKTFVTRTNVRKIFNTLGFGIESLCLFSLSFVYDGLTALALLSVGTGMSGLAISGWQVNHLDLAPQIAGILVAVSQCFSNIAGIISPLVAGVFIQESGTLSEAIGKKWHRVENIDIYGWHLIFLVSSLIVLICCVFYILFASGELQVWANVELNKQLIDHQKGAQISVSYQALNLAHEGIEKKDPISQVELAETKTLSSEAQLETLNESLH